MAGPTLQLRAKIFGNSEKHKIKKLLDKISILAINEENKFEFHFKKGKNLGLFLKESSCLFLMDFSNKTDANDELQQHDFDTKIKDNPQGFINISAMCKDIMDHQLLANFALEINKIVGGFIDLNGAIIPDLQKDKNGDFIHQTQEDYRNFVNAVKGQIHEIKYSIDENRNYYYHIVDAVWLYNWTLHKDFKLIK
jgi:Family of unknown function (DUF6368)